MENFSEIKWPKVIIWSIDDGNFGQNTNVKVILKMRPVKEGVSEEDPSWLVVVVVMHTYERGEFYDTFVAHEGRYDMTMEDAYEFEADCLEKVFSKT